MQPIQPSQPGIHKNPVENFGQNVSLSSDDILVATTHLRDHNIPSIESEQVVLPEQDPVSQVIPYEPEKMIEKLNAVRDQLELQLNEVVVTMGADHPYAMVTLAAQKNFQILLNNIEKRELHEDNFSKILELLQFPGDSLHAYVIEPYDHVEVFLKLPEHVGEGVSKMVHPVRILRTILQGVELIGSGAALIIQSAQYQHAKQLLANMETRLANIIQKTPPEQIDTHPEINQIKSLIAKIRKYISVQWEELKDKIVSFTYSFGLVAAKSTNFILDALHGISHLAKSVVGWVVCVLDVIWAAITLWRSQKAKNTHEVWMEQVSANPSAVKSVQELLAKRQERMIMNKAQGLTFEELQDHLVEKGVELDDDVNSLEEFAARLGDDEFRHLVATHFLEASDEQQDTMNAVLRNSIKALAEAKVKNEKKFFDFKLTRSKIELALACLSTAVTITLEVLAIAGVIALAASAMAMPILGLFILGLALMGVGLYYFYKHKPNLFKCYIKGINFRLAFFHIPAKVYEWQRQRQVSKIHKVESMLQQHEVLKGLLEQHQTLDKTIYPEKLQKVLQRMHQETRKKIQKFESLGLDVQIDHVLEQMESKQKEFEEKLNAGREKEKVLSEKLKIWTGEEGKITKLQNQIKEAGVKDFERANGLISHAQQEKKSISEIIVEQMIDSPDELALDEDTIRIFKEKMGINLEQLPQINGGAEKKSLIEKLEEFFKMDDTELLTFMKKQLNDLETAKYINLSEGQTS